MKSPKCPDCPYRYDAPEVWETCMECVDDEDQEPEVPGSDDEDVVLEPERDDTVDAYGYLDLEDRVWDE